MVSQVNCSYVGSISTLVGFFGHRNRVVGLSWHFTETEWWSCPTTAVSWCSSCGLWGRRAASATAPFWWESPPTVLTNCCWLPPACFSGTCCYTTISLKAEPAQTLWDWTQCAHLQMIYENIVLIALAYVEIRIERNRAKGVRCS